MALQKRGSAYTLQVQPTEQDPSSAAALAVGAPTANVNHVLPPVDGPVGPWQRIHPAGDRARPVCQQQQQQQQLSQLGLSLPGSTTFCRLLRALQDRGSANTLQVQHTEQDPLSAAAVALIAWAQPARVYYVLPPVDGSAGPWQRVHPASTAHTEQDPLLAAAAAAAALTAGAQPARVNHVLPPVEGPAGPWQRVHPAGSARRPRSIVSSSSSSSSESWGSDCS
jgi:hypothetical protein